MAEVAVRVCVTWVDPQHYDAQRELPCRVCTVATRMRTRHDEPCHPACFQQALERELVGRAYELLSAERLPLRAVQLGAGESR